MLKTCSIPLLLLLEVPERTALAPEMVPERTDVEEVVVIPMTSLGHWTQHCVPKGSLPKPPRRDLVDPQLWKFHCPDPGWLLAGCFRPSDLPPRF